MSANFKWNKGQDQILSDERDLRVVLLASRRKDNKDIENFKERKIAFLAWFNGYEVPEWVMKKFVDFSRKGFYGETSRMYVSVNKRDPQKIKRALASNLIDDVLGERSVELTRLESYVAGVAARVENKAEDKWLFDFDNNDEKEAQKFIDDAVKEYGEPVLAACRTKNGYAILVEHGFDTRKLLDKWPNVELKKDDLLLLHYAEKEANDAVYNINVIEGSANLYM